MPGPIRPLRSFRALCLAGLVIGSLQACGGRSDTEDYLYDDDVTVGASSAAGGTPGAGASSSAGGKKPGKAGAASTGASAPIGGEPSAGGSVSTGGTTAGAFMMGGASQGGFAQAGTNAGGTGPFIPLTCGGDVCNSLTQVCCASLGGLGCLPADQECGGATLLCGSSSDCTDDQVCCLQLIGETSATAQCKDVCEGGMGGQRERRLCSTDAECSRGRPNCTDTPFGVKVCTRF